MSDSKEIIAMRAMEWERAKGSIRAILALYWNLGSEKFNELDKIAKDFFTEFGEKGGID